MWNKILILSLLHLPVHASDKICLQGFSQISQKSSLESVYKLAQKHWEEKRTLSNLDKSLSRLQKYSYIEEEDRAFFRQTESEIRSLKLLHKIFSPNHESNPTLEKLLSNLEEMNSSESMRAGPKQIKQLAIQSRSLLQKIDLSLPNSTSFESFQAYARKANTRILSIINNETTSPLAVDEVCQDLMANILLLRSQPNQNIDQIKQAIEAYEALSKVNAPFIQQMKEGDTNAGKYKIILNELVKERLKKALNHF